MMISEFEKDFYKDSVNILGVSMDELEQFMNPSADHSLIGKSVISGESQAFMMRLDKMIEIPESLNQDLDIVCNHCVKLIQEINQESLK